MFTTLVLALIAPLVDVRLPAGPGPVTNPLKGYAPYVQDGGLKDVPTTMAFYETSWRDLEPKEGEYAFADWEAKTMRSDASKDKRIVLRVWMDYPNMPVGVPQWLLDKGVKMTDYTDFGGGKSPDYANPQLREALKRFIGAMGARWNKDPQVAFVQMGILGHWGEWHTYPRPELFAPPEVQREVVDGMRAAFPDKKIMARNAVDYPGKQAWVGFHDDMIPEDTLGPDEWAFLPTMRAAGRDSNWKVAPTGGEMVPGAAERYLGKDWPLTMKAVKEAHLSWIGPYCPTLVDSKDATFLARAAELSHKLGYEFRLDLVRATTGSGKVTVKLTGINQGVAPFYYRWPVRLALLDSKGNVATSADVNTDVRTWQPGAFSFDAALPKPAKTGAYRLSIGLIDPWTGKPSVRFANRLPVLDGWTILTPLSL
ncbi:hypothetical protein BH11ARM2_BH11ARM2_22870 [soil metagenome]